MRRGDDRGTEHETEEVVLLSLMIGLATAAAATDCPGGSQTELIECADLAAQAADAQLNRQWRLTVQAVRELDKQVDAARGAGFRPFDAYNDLVRAQRAWIAYRDAECISEADQVAGGRDTNLVSARCVERLAKDRMSELAEIEKGRP